MNVKKICIISLSNLYLTPYLQKYIHLIQDLGYEYDIIYWNREAIDEACTARNVYGFRFESQSVESKLKKIRGYLYFVRFAKKILNKNHYDKVVVLHTSLAVLMSFRLISKYCNNYLIDIRDYTLENNRIFSFFLKRLVSNSGLNVISSEGFKDFLPKSEYVTVHNNINISLDDYTRDETIEVHIPIRISCIGKIRFFEQNKRVIQKFKNDKRFEIVFAGKDACLLQTYVDEQKITNVKLFDKFSPEKTLDFYRETDIINNLYGNNSPLLDYALSNKLYYAAKLNIPILVCKNTYMEKISIFFGFGYVFELEDPQACDRLFEYFTTFDRNKFQTACHRFNKKVELQNAYFNERFTQFIKK